MHDCPDEDARRDLRPIAKLLSAHLFSADVFHTADKSKAASTGQGVSILRENTERLPDPMTGA